jgi:hypothetical protein
MSEKDTKKTPLLTKDQLKSRINAVKSGRTSVNMAAGEIFNNLKNAIKTINMAKGGAVKKKKIIRKKK